MKLGLILAQERDLAAAATELTEAVRLNPRNADAQNGLGVVLAQQGNLRDAIRHFAAAVHFAPDNEGARRNLILALARVKKESVGHP